MLEELVDMPDAVLVEVESDHEYVRVSKEGNTIRVLVETGGDRIAIAMPARVLRSVGGFLSG